MEQQFGEEAKKLSHPYYKIMELELDELEAVLSKWTRLDLIEWLCWNDRNGIYRDEDSMAEVGEIVTKELGMEIIIRQIREGRGY